MSQCVTMVTQRRKDSSETRQFNHPEAQGASLTESTQRMGDSQEERRSRELSGFYFEYQPREKQKKSSWARNCLEARQSSWEREGQPADTTRLTNLNFLWFNRSLLRQPVSFRPAV